MWNSKRIFLANISPFCFRVLVLKTLARITELVKAVLLTKAIAVCVLLDSRVRLVTKVKRTIY